MEARDQAREKVTGIGGVFFKSKDPESLVEWYKKNLGVPAEGTFADFGWRDKVNPAKTGRTVWSAFPADTDYFGPSKSMFMLNYRVENLDRMLEQLRQAGVEVHKVEDFDYGRFAWITDPDGNRVELWEPKGE
jgi:predicted enzyme related to lactoylglutathione lyase